MNQTLIKKLQDRFLGKRIKVPFHNDTGYGIKVKDDFIVGTCNFIGINPNFTSKGLQVTVNRMPMWGVDHNKIELVDEPRSSFL